MMNVPRSIGGFFRGLLPYREVLTKASKVGLGGAVTRFLGVTPTGRPVYLIDGMRFYGREAEAWCSRQGTRLPSW